MTGGLGKVLRTALLAKRIVVAPGAFDAKSARIVARHGFDGVFMGGSAIAGSYGFSDGMTTLTEVAERTRTIVRATGLPVIVDADTGFGNDDSLKRTIRELEEAGAAAIMIEDQRPSGVNVSKGFIDTLATGGAQAGAQEAAFGGLDAASLLYSPAEMAERYAMASAARRSQDTILIARTDAMAIEGMERAIERGNLYAKAGADLVMVQQPRTLEEAAKIASGLRVGFVTNTTLLAPAGATIDQLGAAGVKLVLYSSQHLRMGWQVVDDALARLKSEGTFGDMIRTMMPIDLYRKLSGN